ncbi:MAG TPA: L-seryl-tRNA(Sec) selenium transferase [Acidimicrobiales bacterium]|nr:L-seryl-tRNA(Sec) selenium transferase [Acidimicrobiales bacterium]
MAAHPPSVDALARELADVGLPHPLLVDAAREAVAAGDPESARARAEAVARSLLRPVVNATGVLLHTNLGRAPLGAHQDARYANLEFDLGTGRRGSRSRHAGALLARACGAEAALVVNNGAAALLLVLSALARDRSVVVSRGELVEIGGGFRVPEVMAASGAHLVEVGTTNRTRLRDFTAALGTEPALLLKVHQSNYRIVGFTEDVVVRELSGLGVPVVADIGSGLLDAATPWLEGGPPAWLASEPAARQTLAAGAALVTFSGDKLLGGPQAGIIAGSEDLVAQCARHPLARALRPGGLVLGALQEVALAYLRRDGDAIPFWRMAASTVEVLRARAAALVPAGGAEVVDCDSVPGGGSVPGLTIPSTGLSLDGDHSAALRAHDPPVIARVHEGRTILDLRTVDPADDPVVAKALASLGAAPDPL